MIYIIQMFRRNWKVYKPLKGSNFTTLLRSWLEKLQITFSESCDISQIKLESSNTKLLFLTETDKINFNMQLLLYVVKF